MAARKAGQEKPAGELGRLIQQHMDKQRYRLSKAELGKALGVSRQTVGNWMDGTSFPTAENVRQLASELGLSYTRVLDAALIDKGYLPKEPGHEPATITPAAGAAAKQEPVRVVRVKQPPSGTQTEAIPQPGTNGPSKAQP